MGTGERAQERRVQLAPAAGQVVLEPLGVEAQHRRQPPHGHLLDGPLPRLAPAQLTERLCSFEPEVLQPLIASLRASSQRMNCVKILTAVMHYISGQWSKQADKLHRTLASTSCFAQLAVRRYNNHELAARTPS